MDNNYIDVFVNGYVWYLEADRYYDLQFLEGRLVNVSNSSITLVSNYQVSNSYPRITCAAMSPCIYRYSAQSQNEYVYSDIRLADWQKFNINTLGINGLLSLILMFNILLLGVKLIWKK